LGFLARGSPCISEGPAQLILIRLFGHSYNSLCIASVECSVRTCYSRNIGIGGPHVGGYEAFCPLGCGVLPCAGELCKYRSNLLLSFSGEKMEVEGSPETLAINYRTTQRQIPEESNLYNLIFFFFRLRVYQLAAFEEVHSSSSTFSFVKC
jgi:hypothetical protein